MESLRASVKRARSMASSSTLDPAESADHTLAEESWQSARPAAKQLKNCGFPALRPA
jgi:hypothetical protein